MKYSLLAVLLILIPLQLSLLYFKNTPQSIGSVAGISSSQSKDVSVSAFIGDHRFSLYGYTSPQATVTLEGMGIFDQTVANDKGYFQFNNRFSPLSKREACLSSKDQFGRISSPVCLPPFPVNYDASIGPVIMPPTLSLNQSDYFIGDQAILSGQSIPSNQVNFSLFTDNKPQWYNFFAFLQPKIVEAFGFPDMTTQTDKKGNFSFTLPSYNPKKFRLFAQADYQKLISPESVRLSFDILPVWMIIVKIFAFLFSLIRPRLLEILIIGEIIFIAYFILKKLFHHQTALMIRENQLLMIKEEKSIVKEFAYSIIHNS